MAIAGVVYPGKIPEESATKRMLSLSPHFPHHIWQDAKTELGSAILGQKETPLSPFFGILVLLDGILYNIDEINQEIQRHHPQLHCHTTEECIAALYSIHQENAFGLLNGNFALALYDEQKLELLLARDRIGEKSLYWTSKNSLFLFANSLKAILASRLVSQTPDLEALSFFISFGFIPQEKSPIQGVFKLQPGHYLKVTKEKNLLIRPYWSYNSYLSKKRTDFSEEEIKIASAKAWQKRISSSPPLVFAEKDPAIEQEAGAPLHFLQPQKNLTAQSVFSDLHSMIWHLDEPVADLSLPSLWQTCKQLKADRQTELFFTTGSVPFFKQEIHPPRLSSFKPFNQLERLFKQQILIPLFYKLHPKTAYEMLRSIHTHPWHIAFLNQTALFDKSEFYDLHSHLLHPVNNEIFLHRFPALERLGPTYSSLMYLYHKIKLPAAVLFPQEKFCSHFGIIRKAPYLDTHMVELLASVPNTDTGFSYAKMFTTGSIAPRVASLPSWTKEIATDDLTKKLSKSVLVEAGLFSPKWLSEQMRNFNRHPHLFFQELWGLLVLEIWFRLFIEGTIAKPSIIQDEFTSHPVLH